MNKCIGAAHLIQLVMAAIARSQRVLEKAASMPIRFQVDYHIFNSIEMGFQLVFYLVRNGMGLFNGQSHFYMN